MTTEAPPARRSFKDLSTTRKTALFFGSFAVMLLLAIVAGVLLAPDYTRIETPAGYPINTMAYLPLDDETSIWISVWLPDDLATDQKLATVIQTTRYALKWDAGWLGKVLQTYFGMDDANHEAARVFTDRGYAFVHVQSPGSGQSTGPRMGEYPVNEIDAQGLAVDWIAEQSWSNQRVGATGHSYSATTADRLPATERPQVKAVFPSAPDFDVYAHVIVPGGLASESFVGVWNGFVNALDTNDLCLGLGTAEGRPMSVLQCMSFKGLFSGLKQPHGNDQVIYRRALADHKNNLDLVAALKSSAFKDSRFGGLRHTLDDVSLYAFKDAIDRAAVNTYTRVGWMDAGTVEGALQKYLTMTSPQQVVIYPFDHTFSADLDPFGEPVPRPREERVTELFDFFDSYLKEDGGVLPREIRYFTFGNKSWRTTTVWPPEGITNTTWFFSEDHGLTETAPRARRGSDAYEVDFSTTTGEKNRWMTQMGQPVEYPDRREEDAKLLTYTSAPLAYDLEVTGSPTVNVHMSSSHPDGALYVYLEDVGPDGRVSYLTEGLLRVIHRKTRDPRTAPYVPLGVFHSFNERDAAPMAPGETAEIAITLLPISTVFRKGHSIRVAIAGHDQAKGDRYPSKGNPKLTIERTSAHPSNIELPSIWR